MYDTIIGINIRDFLSIVDLCKYIYVIHMSVTSMMTGVVFYTIADKKFVALIEPMDDSIVRAHEILVTDTAAEALQLLERIKKNLI